MKNLISVPQLSEVMQGLKQRWQQKKLYCQMCKLEKSLWMLGRMNWQGDIWRHRDYLRAHKSSSEQKDYILN